MMLKCLRESYSERGKSAGGHLQVSLHSLRVFDVGSTRDGRPRLGHFGF